MKTLDDKWNLQCIASNTGDRCLSEIVSTHPTTCDCHHGVHGIDVEQPGPSVVMALVHCVHAQIPRPAPRFWLTTFGDPHSAGLCIFHLNPDFPVRFRTPQIVQMRYRDPGQLFYSCLQNTSYSRRSIRRTAGPDKRSWATSTSAKRAASSVVYRVGKRRRWGRLAWIVLPSIHWADEPRDLRSAPVRHSSSGRAARSLVLLCPIWHSLVFSVPGSIGCRRPRAHQL
jgi:hypothetical protein